MSWHLAPSLKQLLAEVNARWPSRDKSWDGSIGDAAHSARASDHNPNSRGSVNAIDVTNKGIDHVALRKLLVTKKRVNYVISDGIIYSRVRDFAPKTYTGSNPHDHHVHVSLLQEKWAEDDTTGWGVSKLGGASKPTKITKPTKVPAFPLPDGWYFGPRSGPKRSVSGYAGHRADLRTWQSRMKARGWSIAADGLYGDGTAKVARQFQHEKGLSADGLIGADTWAAAWTEKVT